MKKQIPLIQWKNNLSEVTPADKRINEDFLLVDQYEVLDFMYEPFRLDVTTAIFYHEGEGDVLVNMRLYHVKAPAMLIIINDQTMQWIPQEKLPKATCIVMSKKVTVDTFPNKNDTHLLYKTIIANQLFEFDKAENITANLYLQSVTNALSHTNNPFRLEVCRYLTLAFFFDIMRKKQMPTEEPEKNSRSNEITFEFLSMLREHFREQRELSFYADKLCLTTKHLSKVIKETSGRTVGDWIDEYVTTEAKVLLRSTNMTIAQIADELNFDSQSLFGKFFRRVTGMSPTEYRNRY
jgi:AraC-like DNA-binding protein